MYKSNIIILSIIQMATYYHMTPRVHASFRPFLTYFMISYEVGKKKPPSIYYCYAV